jgi:hypothetical protein
MGVIAESMAGYAQPLIDATDGSIEQVQKALNIAMMCWNLAILPPQQREAAIEDMRARLEMGEAEFDEFRQSILNRMIRRHIDMFPGMHGALRDGGAAAPHLPWPTRTGPATSEDMGLPTKTGNHPKVGRYDPCPCGSGKKYKWCCEKKGR